MTENDGSATVDLGTETPETVETSGAGEGAGNTEVQEDPKEHAALAEVALPDVKPLTASRLQPFETKNASYVVIALHGVTPQHLLKTSFWQHHTQQLKRGDEVRVEAEDGSFVAWLYVQAVGPKDVKMQLRQSINLDPMSPEDLAIPDGHTVVFRGLISKWSVLRKDDNGKFTDVLKEGFESKSAATRWLGAHVMSLSR